MKEIFLIIMGLLFIIIGIFLFIKAGRPNEGEYVGIGLISFGFGFIMFCLGGFLFYTQVYL